MKSICKRFFIKKEELMLEIKAALKEIPAKSLDETIINSEDFFEILKESGLIGKIHRERYVESNNYYFDNNKVLKILIALYEYQVKEKLPFQNEDICVLHPMCYEYYENEIDYNTLVYPASVDDEEDLGDVGKYLIDLLFDEEDESFWKCAYVYRILIQGVINLKTTDISKILSIAASIAALFNLNNIQQNRLNLYVKNNMYEWVEKRKSDSEIEQLIKTEARTLN